MVIFVTYDYKSLPTFENSVQKNIFPVSIIKTEHLKEFGIDFALNPFMNLKKKVRIRYKPSPKFTKANLRKKEQL